MDKPTFKDAPLEEAWENMREALIYLAARDALYAYYEADYKGLTPIEMLEALGVQDPESK